MWKCGADPGSMRIGTDIEEQYNIVRLDIEFILKEQQKETQHCNEGYSKDLNIARSKH